MSGRYALDDLDNLEQTLARSLYSWIRADTFTSSGGLVTSFVDRVALQIEGSVRPNARSANVSHAFTQSNNSLKVATPVASDLYNNRIVASFSAAQYSSTLTVANWATMVSTMAVYAIGHRSGASFGYVCNANGPGSRFGLGVNLSAGQISFVGNGGVTFSSAAGILPINVPGAFGYEKTAGIRVFYPLSNVVFSNPSIGNSNVSETMSIGARSPTASSNDVFVGTLADVMFASVADASLRELVGRYAQLRYGVGL